MIISQIQALCKALFLCLKLGKENGMSENQRTLTANFTADTSGFSPKVNELIQKLKVLNQDFEQNKSKVKELSAQLKTYETELKKLNTATDGGAKATDEQKARMQALRDSIAACNVQIGSYKAAQGQLRSQINSTNKELTEQQHAFAETSGAVSTFGDVLKANLAADFIKNSVRELVDLLRQAAAYCYQVGSSFEAGMSQVAAVSGASGAELEQLTAKAKELGASTKFTATETAEALNYMAMAGWKTEEMLDGIDGVLSLAAASGADLGTTSDIVTDALTAFGMTAADCSHFADVLAAASSNANTNVTMMGETFKYCAPIAGALGFSAEDTAVAIGLMANSGIKASQAGTALRTIMTKLSSDVKISGEKIGEVVVQTKNADGSMRGLSDIVNDLRTAFSGLSESEQSAAAKNIAGAEAMSGFLAIMNAGEADVRKLASAIDNCSGAASAMAETMQENLSGAVTIFNSALEGVGIAVYDKFKGALTDTVNIFTECLSEMTDEIDNNGALGESIEDLAESFRDAAKEIAVLVKDNLPGVINFFSRAIKLVVDFRKEIGAALKGILAYKGLTAIGGIIQSVIGKFTALKAAVTASEGAVKGLSAAFSTTPWGLIAAGIGVVVGVITDIASHAETAAQKIERLRNESDEAARSAEEYAQKSDDLRKAKERYDEIYNSEKSSYEKGLKLKDLQEQLISQYPDLAGRINLATGAYEEQAEAIRKVIDEQNEYALDQAEISLNKANELEDIERGRTFEAGAVEFNSFNNDDVRKTIEEIAKNNKNITTEALQGAVGGFSIKIDGDSAEKQAAIDEILGAFREKGYNKLYKNDFEKFVNYVSPYAEQAAKTKQAQELWNKLEAKRAGIEDVDYAGSVQNTLQYDAELYEQEEELAAQHYDNLGKMREDNLSGEKETLDEMQSAYKKMLAAIDAEYEKHKRAKSDSEFQSKINEIDKELQYGRVDEFERYELEKRRKKLIDDHNEELYSRGISDLKSGVTDVYNAKKALAEADSGTKEYTLALTDYTDKLGELNATLKGLGGVLGINGSSVSNIDESVKNNYVNVIVQAVSKSNGQLVEEIMKALYSGI